MTFTCETDTFTRKFLYKTEDFSTEFEIYDENNFKNIDWMSVFQDKYLEFGRLEINNTGNHLVFTVDSTNGKCIIRVPIELCRLVFQDLSNNLQR